MILTYASRRATEPPLAPHNSKGPVLQLGGSTVLGETCFPLDSQALPFQLLLSHPFFGLCPSDSPCVIISFK